MASDPETILKEVQSLVEDVSQGCIKQYQGSWTMSIYDTAWLSMIEHPDGTFLFPDCFEYVLREQERDIGWKNSGSNIDEILNSLAALLAIEKHLASPEGCITMSTKDLEARKSRGMSSLRSALLTWDVGSCMHVGFEVLVPALLSMLEGYGTMVQFPGRGLLLELNKQKLKGFKLESLYGPNQSTLLHSIEAFTGKVEFSKLRHHLVGGSMLGSPSATAAYLMGMPEWDNRAQRYLQECVLHGGGGGRGGVPSAYPCEIFEFSWVVSTLHLAGVAENVFQTESFSRALDEIELQVHRCKGTIGFAAGMLPDADDTAKSLYILNSFGRPTPTEPLTSQFMSVRGHIMTYPGERNPSPSANCNTLLCMLTNGHSVQSWQIVKKITESLFNCWWNDKMEDKWNVSRSYTSMLLAQALKTMLRLWDLECIPDLMTADLQDRLAVIISQLINGFLICSKDVKTLQESYPETVAYQVLACSTLRSLPIPSTLQAQLDTMIEAGKAYLSLSDNLNRQRQYLWIEKTTYGSGKLSMAYCLSALITTPDVSPWGNEITNLLNPSCRSIGTLSTFFRSIGGIDEPIWKFQACVYEATAFTTMIRKARGLIFPLREGIKDNYLNYITVVWVVTNRLRHSMLPTGVLWEMMKFSLLDYLVDEYMESSIALLSTSEHAIIESYLSQVLSTNSCHERTGKKRSLPQDCDNGFLEASATQNQSEGVQRAVSVLAKYIRQITSHPILRSASQNDRKVVHSELHDFLLAHMIQIRDNAVLSIPQSTESVGKTKVLVSPRQSFYDWTRTTASQHTSCPVSFAFYCCILSRCKDDHNDCFTTPTQKYLANDLCAHLSAMSRIFNDFSSIGRDRREGNLNSVNFPEFHHWSQEQRLEPNTTRAEPIGQETYLQSSLLQLGEYERKEARSTLSCLLKEIREEGKGKCATVDDFICRGLRLFNDVTEMFADMYVARDLTNAAR